MSNHKFEVGIKHIEKKIPAKLLKGDVVGRFRRWGIIVNARKILDHSIRLPRCIDYRLHRNHIIWVNVFINTLVQTISYVLSNGHVDEVGLLRHHTNLPTKTVRRSG